MESLLASLGLVFVAELGDKTQLVALGFGAPGTASDRCSSGWPSPTR